MRDRARERVSWQRGIAGIELLEAEFDRHVYDRHTHDTYAIGVTLRGVQRFRCRNATHDSIPGHVIVINPGEAHDGRSGAAGGYAYRMFYVGADAIDIALRTPLIPDSDLCARLDRAWKTMARSPGSLAADDRLHRCLSRLAVHGMAPRPEPRATREERGLRHVRDYLHDHVEHEVTVAQLAAIAAMSRFQLTRRFEQAYGLPLHAYHLHVRLEEAKRRLAIGQAIAAVSADLGFVDQSHFHRRFRGSFGMTPGAWRAAHGYKTARTPAAYHPAHAGDAIRTGRRGS